MNIIQNQADVFIRRKLKVARGHKNLISDLRSELFEYRKAIHKIEFVERVIQKAKIDYDNHLKVCQKGPTCSNNIFYENTLFFLQEELDELEDSLPPEDFKKFERELLNTTLQTILDDLNEIKLGQQLTYNDLSDEFDELKDLYYLNKKNWMQLFNGKITEMVAGGVISETLSKDIVRILAENYDKLIAS
jgi:hypothetical protein